MWTGTEVVIWGGYEVDATGNALYLADGARYDPMTETWATMSPIGAPSAQAAGYLLWTGTEVVVPGSGWLSGGAWDPVLDQWRPIVVPAPEHTSAHAWTGSELLYWGADFGNFADPPVNDGQRWDPLTDTWSPMSIAGAPAPRISALTGWAGGRLIVTGGSPAGLTPLPPDDGGRYDPATDTWATITDTGGPGLRTAPSVVSTGTELIVWGGARPMAGTPTGLEHLADGYRYDPEVDVWTPMSDVRAPEPRIGAPAVWTGEAMVVCGGSRDGYRNGTGGRYYP